MEYLVFTVIIIIAATGCILAIKKIAPKPLKKFWTIISKHNKG